MRMTPKWSRDEQGSAMIIAITVIAMVSILSVAVVGRTSNGLKSSRQNQDFAGALANADAGVSDALFRIDQQGTGMPIAFCVGTGCSVADVPGAPGVTYKVEVIDRSTVRVKSKGLANGVPHAVEAEFIRQLEFPFAIFTRSYAAFKGSVNAPSCTTASMPCEGVYYVDDQEPPGHLPDESAVVGTTGTVECTGTGSPADEFVTFPGGNNNGCPYHTNVSGVYDPQDPIAGPCPPPEATPPTPCLGDLGTYTALSASECANREGVLTPGRYLCTAALTFEAGPLGEPVTIGPGSANNGRVEFFVLPSAGSADLSIDNVDVNYHGDPTKFRINMAGSGDLLTNGANAGTINGIIYMPSGRVRTNGCKVKVRGSLVANEYRCNGAPNLQMQYDARIATLQQSNWQLQNFREIPSGDVVIP